MRLGQKHGLGTVYYGLWAVYGDLERRMVLERSITANGRSRETVTEALVLKVSITAYGRCRKTGTEAWSWNSLSRLQGDVG